MHVRTLSLCLLIAVYLSAPFAAAQSPESGASHGKRDVWSDTAPVVTRNQVTVGGKSLRYAATAGHMPIRSEEGAVEATLFYTSYTLEGAGAENRRRPITFVFNGGPGTGTAWLHLGGLGPRKIKLEADGAVPAPPYTTIENPDTLLDVTDLVFVDAPGTGYSRVKPDQMRKYFSLYGDLEAFGKFIRSFLSMYNRWDSPLFLFGESYGTTRAAGLANHLIDIAIPVNGVVLMSVALDLQTLTPGNLNDLPYVVIVPSYTLLAHYHKKLPASLSGNIDATLKKVEEWCLTEYLTALAKGNALSAEERRKVVTQLAAYTGLPESLIEQHNLRIDATTFRENLLKDRGLQVGRIDGRVTGPVPNTGTPGPLYDPSMSTMFPAFSAMMTHFAETELGYKAGMEYRIFSARDVLMRWDWGPANGGYPQTATLLQSAMAKTKYIKVLVLDGMYDLATPYFASEYTFNHINLGPEYLKNIRVARFRAGHMIYADEVASRQMKQALAEFYQQARGGH